MFESFCSNLDCRIVSNGLLHGFKNIDGRFSSVAYVFDKKIYDCCDGIGGAFIFPKAKLVGGQYIVMFKVLN